MHKFSLSQQHLLFFNFPNGLDLKGKVVFKDSYHSRQLSCGDVPFFDDLCSTFIGTPKALLLPIYKPLRSSAKCADRFIDCLVITVDFNIHTDIPNDKTARGFCGFIYMLYLLQHMKGPKYKQGHNQMFLLAWVWIVSMPVLVVGFFILYKFSKYKIMICISEHNSGCFMKAMTMTKTSVSVDSV